MPDESCHVVHRYDDPTPESWTAYIAAMHSGRPVEIDEEMSWYWLEVLPPVWMGRTINIPGWGAVRCDFGFAEGAEPVVAFWRHNGRFWCCQTTEINNC